MDIEGNSEKTVSLVSIAPRRSKSRPPNPKYLRQTWKELPPLASYMYPLPPCLYHVHIRMCNTIEHRARLLESRNPGLKVNHDFVFSCLKSSPLRSLSDMMEAAKLKQ